jgi:hypothetical protein
MIRSLTLVFVLVLGGCVCDAAKTQADVTAAAHDGYARLIREGVAELTTADKAGLTPKTRALLNNTVTSVFKSRRAWHKLNFALNEVALPDDLDTIPVVESPSLLGD